jgi:hypothetical protein
LLRYQEDLEIWGSGDEIWRSEDLEVHQGTGSATKKIWRSGDLVMRSGDLEVHQGTGSATKEIWRSGGLEIWRSTKGLAPLPRRSGDLGIYPTPNPPPSTLHPVQQQIEEHLGFPASTGML